MINVNNRTESEHDNNLVKVLLVEDNLADVRLLMEMINERKDMDISIDNVNRLSNAEDRLNKVNYDIVLLDLGLPDSKGIGTFDRLKVSVPNVPIIILSGLSDEMMALEAVKKGAQDYLMKREIDSRLLIRAIKYAIGRWLAEQKLKEQSALLIQTEKMSALGTLVAGVAHELNNPMMGILNFSEYCMKYTDGNDRRYSVLEDIQRETKRCIDIVRNLTTFSRMEVQGEEEYQQSNFSTIIDRVIKLLSYRIEKGKVSLLINIDEDIPDVMMRITGMQQVLLNIMINALDAVDKCEKKEIGIEISHQHNYIQMAISDNGPGIAANNLDKIFDPFFTTKDVGKGTGLGLAISKSIIESQGGSINCKTQLGTGTIFTIIFPIKTGS